MRTIDRIIFLMFLPIIGLAQELQNDRLESSKPNIFEFTQQRSLLNSFSSFISVDELDPRIKYMYQEGPYQRSINMSELARRSDRSEEWYHSDKESPDFAQRQQEQINESIKVFTRDDDAKVKFRVEEGFQNRSWNRMNRFNGQRNGRFNNYFYYPQRNVSLEIDLSDD